MNLKEIFELMDKFDSSNLSEIKVQIADTSVSFKKPGPAPVIAAGGYMPHPGMAMAAPAHHADAAPAAAGSAPASKPGVELITSPIVGTFYRSAAPDTPSFVQEGSVAENGSTLCILEAMKVMNRLEAEFKCEIIKILATNGQMVEFGTPLFEVKRV